ncbi:MAG: hypothetical protein ACLPSH_03690 [Vulcanimicrobiaceae bacterium]
MAETTRKGILVRLSPQQAKALRRVALETDSTMQNIVATLISDYLARKAKG